MAGGSGTSPDVVTIRTRALLLTKAAVDGVAADLGVLLVYGSARTGKSYAVAQACAALESPPWFRLDIPPGVRPKELAVRILAAVTGVDHSAGERYGVFESVEELLSRRPVLLWLDNAHNLDREALELLRFFHAGDAHFGLVLSGDTWLQELLSTHGLYESIQYEVPVHPLDRSEVLSIIPEWHPLFRDVDPDLIEHIDEHFSQGRLGNWELFVISAQRLMEQHDIKSLDGAVASAVFALRRRTRPNLARKDRHSPRKAPWR
jgi:hypothetical protein